MEKIQLYHRLFAVCMAGALACIMLSAVLFIRLDIRTAFGIFTGKRKKQGIRSPEAPDGKKEKKRKGKLSRSETEETQLICEGTGEQTFLIEREVMLARAEEVIEGSRRRKPERFIRETKRLFVLLLLIPALSVHGWTGGSLSVQAAKMQDSAAEASEPEKEEVDPETVPDTEPEEEPEPRECVMELSAFSIEGNTGRQIDGVDLYRCMDGRDVTIYLTIFAEEDNWNPGMLELQICSLVTEEPAETVNGADLIWETEEDRYTAAYDFDAGPGSAATVYAAVLACIDTAEAQLTGPGVSDGIYRSNPFMTDHEAPNVRMLCSPAVRLVCSENTESSADLINQEPETGYTAYYTGNVEVRFSVEEPCAAPEYEGSRLVGLADFELYAAGTEKGRYQPEIQWKQEGGWYEGRFELAEEDCWHITIQYEDLAGNILSMEDSPAFKKRENGAYESTTLVIDRTPPVIQAAYTDVSGDEILETGQSEDGERDFFSEPVYLKVSVQDRNLRYEELKEALKNIRIFGSDRTELTGSNAEVFIENIDGGQMAQEGLTWYIPFTTEANYDLIFSCTDLSGNESSHIRVQSCVDMTRPELTLSYYAGEEAYLDRVNYRELGYLFSDREMEIRAYAEDTVSGIHSIRFTVMDEDGRITEKSGSCESEDAQMFEASVLLPGRDFKGTVKVETTDWCGNVTEEAHQYVVESSEQHSHSGAISIITETAPSRVVGEETYYNTDVQVRVRIQDQASGLQRIAWTAGNSGSESIDYASRAGRNLEEPPEEDLVYEYEEQLVLRAAENNENQVRVSAEYEDHAGHGGAAEQFYHVDITPPVVEVSYDLNEPSEERFYRQARTATVTVRERNFDSGDVNFVVTSTEGAMPSFGDWDVSGEGDNTEHVCSVVFEADGAYTFTVEFEDLAGNRAEYDRVDEFTIDRTEPELTVTFDNNSGRNGYYYAESRTAVLDVLEHNFDERLINLSIHTEDGPDPLVSGWIQEGDHHWASIIFSEDGGYVFALSGMDQAGNQMETYEEEYFVIDRTAPELEIQSVENHSANNGAVTPRIRYSDQNSETESLDIVMTGYRNGVQEIRAEHTALSDGTGMEIQFEDFAWTSDADDLYELNVSALDLAGNRSDADIVFSVNRFGSVYTFDEKTERMLQNGKDVCIKEAQEIVVTETNVDTLEFREILCSQNGKLCTLSEGADYTVELEESDAGWRQYTYRIGRRNFEEEGFYAVMIYSEDRASNVSGNSAKGKKIEFAVDRTEPSIVLSGVEDGKKYQENSREVVLDVQDNIRLLQVTVITEEGERVYSGSEVQRMNGRIVLKLGSADHWQTLCVRAYDAAGNVSGTDRIKFLITPKLLVRLMVDPLPFLGTAAGFLAAGMGVWFWRRKNWR